MRRFASDGCVARRPRPGPLSHPPRQLTARSEGNMAGFRASPRPRDRLPRCWAAGRELTGRIVRLRRSDWLRGTGLLEHHRPGGCLGGRGRLFQRSSNGRLQHRGRACDSVCRFPRPRLRLHLCEVAYVDALADAVRVKPQHPARVSISSPGHWITGSVLLDNLTLLGSAQVLFSSVPILWCLLTVPVGCRNAPGCFGLLTVRRVLEPHRKHAKAVPRRRCTPHPQRGTCGESGAGGYLARVPLLALPSAISPPAWSSSIQ